MALIARNAMRSKPSRRFGR